MNKKIIYFLSIIIGVLFICNTSFATDENLTFIENNEGIMLTSTIDETTKNEDGSSTYNYTYHGTSAIYEGSVTIPAEYFDGTYDTWCLFILNDGTPCIFVSLDGRSTFIFSFVYTASSNTTSVKAYLSDSSTSSVTFLNGSTTVNSSNGFGMYYLNGSWVTMTQSTKYASNSLKNILFPTGYLFSRNCDLVFCDYLTNNAHPTTNCSTKYSSYHPLQSACFYGTSPYLIELSDTTYKVALGTLYEGYTFTDDTGDFVNVTATTINNLFVYIYDMTEDDGNYFWSISYNALREYIYYDENYGMVLEMPFDTAFGDGFFEYGHKYCFQFKTSGLNTILKDQFQYSYYDESDFSSEITSFGSGNTTGGGTEGDDTTNDQYNELQNTIVESNNQLNNTIADQTNAINSQTDAIKEQNETSKGMWETIKEMLSYLNPFSENFFAYKLLDLLYEGLKALFIPSDDFLSNWFTEVNDYFADQFGILYYPVDVVISFLNALDVALVDKEPILNIPAFRLSFMGYSAELLPATTYNFNTLLENETFAKVHTFYIFFVNVIFTIGLLAFASKIFTEIFGGIDDSVDHAIYNSQADARAYNQVRRQSEARKAYQRNTKGG